MKVTLVVRILLLSLIFAAALGYSSLQPVHAEVRTSPSSSVERPTGPNRCSSLLRECFSYDGEERSECFYAVASHAFCAGEKIGEIALKRWAASPDYVAGSDKAAQALLGPQLVDQACLANFDNTFSSELIRGAPHSDRIDWLSDRLNSCILAPSEDIFVP